MKIETLHSGSLKIWMTDTDMNRWGLCFEDLGVKSKTTRAVVGKLVNILRQRAHLKWSDSLTVEAVPVDGGCLLLFTPHPQHCPDPVPEVKVFAIRDTVSLLQLCGAFRAVSVLPSASLYRFGGEYRLAVYPDSRAFFAVCRKLSEFGDVVGEGYTLVSFVEEHGQAISVGDALQRVNVGNQ